jgi:O-methyltransferase
MSNVVVAHAPQRARFKHHLKRSAALHSLYKIARDWREIPSGRRGDLLTLAKIFKIYPRTMLEMPRLFDLADIVRAVDRDRIPGDFVECGVWNGGAVGLMGLVSREPRTIHLFDSFEGLPEPSEEDGVSNARSSRGPLKALGACVGEKAPAVRDFLVKRLGLSEESLVFHVGWFQDTVPVDAPSIGKISILRLDGDWYESTRVCLNELYDKLSPGGFLIIDDYGDLVGCRRAVDEFFQVRGENPSFVHSDNECIYFRKAL